jgi:hypothetical protein
MKDIKEYKEWQKALVVYHQSGTSFVEKKTEKMGIANTNISGKMCVPFTKSGKSIEKHGGGNGSLNKD